MRRAPSFSLRRGSVEDTAACFVVFRESLDDLMRRQGLRVAEAPPRDPEASWPAFERVWRHLALTHAEWWIAEDEAGAPLGYARSTNRNGMIELTEFFVRPSSRSSGVGHAVLERAFAPELGARRSVIATTDGPAVSLYLRFGVGHQTTAVDVSGRPRPIEMSSRYDVATGTLGDILAIEALTLGHERREDISFLLANRPSILLRRDGRPVAYAFLPDEHGLAGPIAALDTADIPAALACVESAAHAAGLDTLGLTLPLAARTAAAWLIGRRGFRVDPFYQLLMADSGWAKFDRYLPFNPTLIL